MAKTPDHMKMMQDMMANFPISTSSMQDAMKSQSLLGEKLARMALTAAERSTEISARWSKDAITRIGELAAVKNEPSAYAKAMSDFASATAETAAEQMAAYAEVAKKVQMDTVDFLLTAGKDIGSDTQNPAGKATSDKSE
ncbi:Phasin [Paracoccus liaowanqingii]|uniref:Phasin n=1 Tax=Paracoccus liaowanqingii TaxID=2560053 RepID=A0A4Z1CDY7_9RHOB|nr:Phasin [Paracoccus liaowanqingii]